MSQLFGRRGDCSPAGGTTMLPIDCPPVLWEAGRMLCPLCGRRKARRGCPALGQTICAVCCGTKRLTEIACPPDCGYLASAREHPAALVRRQQERDLLAVLPTLRDLSERQHHLFLVVQALILRHEPVGFARLIDDDVAEAAAAVAATLETSARGVIYEHAPQSLAAQRLANEIKAAIAEFANQAGTGGSALEREMAVVLRRIEKGARETRAHLDGGDTAYLALIGRLLRQGLAEAETRLEDAKSPTLILP